MKNVLRSLALTIVIVMNTSAHPHENQSTSQTLLKYQKATIEQKMEHIAPWEHEDIDWENRKVFYAIRKKEDNEYYISKTMRLFIVDDKVLIEEIPHEPYVYAIKKIEYLDESTIIATIESQMVTCQYYYEFLTGEAQYSNERENSGETAMKFIKDDVTLVWTLTYDDKPARAQFIDSYDIVPSGYYYQNQSTTSHDPEKESFIKQESSKLYGVFDLDEQPVRIDVDSDEYHRMERPYEGTWLELVETEIGYVVYDYPSLFDDGETHNPITIKVDKSSCTTIYPSDPEEISEFYQVSIYLDDSSYYFNLGEFHYSFKWINKEKQICQWTRYYGKPGKIRIWDQGYYINKTYSEYPIIRFDWY